MNKNLLIGVGIVVVLVGGVAVYKMQSFVNQNPTEEERAEFAGRPQSGGQMGRTTTEISAADLSIGQTVAVTGTTTDDSFVAETITVMEMGAAENFGPGPGARGERPEGFGSGERPQGERLQGGESGGPGQLGLQNGFANRKTGEIIEIADEYIVLATMEGVEEKIIITESTKFLQF